MRTLLKSFFLMVFTVFPSALFAASPDIFTVNPNDYSMVFLGQIFGAVGDFLSGNKTAISDLLGTFNSAVLAIGGIIVLYTVVVSTINTAHEGEALGRHWSSIWIPVRSAIGLALLVPPKASSYSIIQVVMMWIVVQGIGAANSIWGTALDAYAKGESVYNPQSPSIVAYVNPAGDILNNLICSYMVKQEIEKSQLYGQGVTIEPYEIDSFGNNNNVFYPGKLIGATGNVSPTQLRGYCGYTTWASVITYAASLVPASQKISAAAQGKEVGIVGTTQAIQSLQGAAQAVALNGGYWSQSAATSLRPAAANAVLSAAIGMSNIITPTLQSLATQGSAGIPQQVINDAKKQGWIMAGLYYYALVKASAPYIQMNDAYVASQVYPTSSGLKALGSGFVSQVTLVQGYTTEPTSGPIGTIAPVPAALQAAQERSSLTSGRLNIDTKLFTKNKKVQSFYKILTLGLSDVVVQFQKIFADGSSIGQSPNANATNPITKIALFGVSTLNIVEKAWIYGAVTVFGLGFLGGLLGCLGAAINALLSWIIPIIIIVMAALLIMGATLGYYVPLVPFLLFIFGAIGWLIGVVEAMVAAPLVAIGVAHPEGQHEIYGKAEPAIYLMLNIFLRPSLMVIGLLAGMALSFVTLNLINVGFYQAFVNVTNLAGGSTIVKGIFPPLMLMIIYTVVVVVVVQKTFGLITIIPDKVLRWVEGGAAVASAFGEEAQGLLQETGGKVGGATGTLGEAHKGAVEGSTKAVGEAGKPVGEATKAAGQAAFGGGGSSDITETTGGGSGSGDGKGGGQGGDSKEQAKEAAKEGAQLALL